MMRFSTALTGIVTAGLIAAPLTLVLADEAPVSTTKPLSAVLESLDLASFGQVVEVEYEHGLWEVKTCRLQSCQKLYVNPQTAAVERQRKTEIERLPAEGATSALDAIKPVEAAQVGTITSLDYEHGQWEVKLVVPADPVK